MSIENQATFYLRNVCGYELNINGDTIVTESVIKGFGEFSSLLRTVYQDWRSYETSTVPSVRTKIGIMSDDFKRCDRFEVFFENGEYPIK